MDRMNVLFLTHTNIDEDSRILKEMGCLADSGYKVSGIGVWSDEGTKKTNLTRKFETTLVSLWSRGLQFLPKLIRHSFSLVELTAKMVFLSLKKRPSVVHCNDTLVLPLGVLIKMLTGAKVVYDAHELESDRNGLSRTLSFLTLKVEKFLWHWVDALIVVSPSIASWYQNNVGSKNVEVILNSPVLTGRSAGSDDYLRKKFSISPDSKVFLYIGIFGEGRGLDLILDAFDSPKVRSSLVFLGYGEMAPRLRKIASEVDNIYVHEAVPHENVVQIASSADFGLCLIEKVSLSDYFSLPNKLFEYSFSGIPVLASEFPDIKQVIDQYGIGTYSSLDVESIRAKVISLQDEKDMRIFNVEELYPLSWKAQEVKLLKLYENVRA
ncbi:MAG: glycosyltransferase [Bdellovibrio sp.]|nr:glycosyltransferase [Bdellovibrio sp.]